MDWANERYYPWNDQSDTCRRPPLRCDVIEPSWRCQCCHSNPRQKNWHRREGWKKEAWNCHQLPWRIKRPEFRQWHKSRAIFLIQSIVGTFQIFTQRFFPNFFYTSHIRQVCRGGMLDFEAWAHTDTQLSRYHFPFNGRCQNGGQRRVAWKKRLENSSIRILRSFI